MLCQSRAATHLYISRFSGIFPHNIKRLSSYSSASATESTSMTVSPLTVDTSLHQNVPSLPSSPSSILVGTKLGKPLPYSAPPIPSSWRESLSAWLQKANSAAPELFLYQHSGYFSGAKLNNAPNDSLCESYQYASEQLNDTGSNSVSASVHLRATLQSNDANRQARNDVQSATVGTQLGPDGKVGSIRLVDIGSETTQGWAAWLGSKTPRLINMLEIGTPRPAAEVQQDTAEEKVVLLHGYGAGTAFFFQNIKALAQHPNSRLYALDWLGMGRSSRVPFHVSSRQNKTMQSRVYAAESFFIQALEDWRQKMGVKKMTLVGHSLGGYLSIAYSLKYPQHVSRLVLVSPAGIPENPEGASQEVPSHDEIAAELQQSQVAPQTEEQERLDEQQVAAEVKASPAKDLRKPDNKQTSRPPRLRPRTRGLVQFLWDANLSPFAILRGSLFFGPMIAGSYTSRRFGTLPQDELNALHAYCYAIFTSKASSEYCLAHLLAPFGYARMPMVHRVAALSPSIPVSFIYGERGIDWMDQEGGRRAVSILREAGNPAARCFEVPNAGHHVYLDNPRAFDTLLSRILRGQTDK